MSNRICELRKVTYPSRYFCKDTFMDIELTSFDGDVLGAVVGLAEGD